MLENFPSTLPLAGIGEAPSLKQLQVSMQQNSTDLGDATALAHMDPPTPPIAATLAGLNARYNQNLLHPDVSPFATAVEQRVVNWLAPAFGMTDGHLCSGSTLANLSALWCARESGAKRVVASADAHISVAKSAHILGLPMQSVPVDAAGRMDQSLLAVDKQDCLVLTAGTTGRGVIDSLQSLPVLWTHVDAAWAGPLRFTRYANLLDGIEFADSMALSAHKWFYQPKDSAMVLFKDPDARQKISYAGSYLTTPNVGIQGSRSAAAIPLFATLLAWGRQGLAQRIEKNMADAESLAAFIERHDQLALCQPPETAVVNWKPKDKPVDPVLSALGTTSSRTSIAGSTWIRQVAANPQADINAVKEKISRAIA